MNIIYLDYLITLAWSRGIDVKFVSGNNTHLHGGKAAIVFNTDETAEKPFTMYIRESLSEFEKRQWITFEWGWIEIKSGGRVLTKAERAAKARIWAYEFLIPREQLKMLTKLIPDCQQIADIYRVPIGFIIGACKHYQIEISKGAIA